MIAVDSSVLIDCWATTRCTPSAQACAKRWARRCVVCEIVVAEVRPGSATVKLMDALGGHRTRASKPAPRLRRCAPLHASAFAHAAASANVSVPDFLIGAHALLQCSALITRDGGFFRDYFKGLKVIVPKAA